MEGNLKKYAEYGLDNKVIELMDIFDKQDYQICKHNWKLYDGKKYELNNIKYTIWNNHYAKHYPHKEYVWFTW